MSTEEKSLTVLDFPLEVHQGVEEVRRIAKSVRSREEWNQKGRKATPREIALSELQRKPYHCRAHSVRTGLACEASAKRAGLCKAHGAEEPGLKKKHQQKLVEMLPKAERALNELLDQ